MSEHSTPDERTEEPTSKRMGQLREEGSLAVSKDVADVLSLATGFTFLYWTWHWFLADFKWLLTTAFTAIADSEPYEPKDYFEGALALLGTFGPEVLLLCLFVGFFSSMSVFLQTNFNVKKKWIDPKFNMLNPVAGITRMFSPNAAMQTLKALMKVGIMLPIGYFALKRYAPEMVNLMFLSIDQIMAFCGMAMIDIFLDIVYLLIALAILDYIWQQYTWGRKNRMTKDEVKDERKAMEGDEKTKRDIQAKGLGRIMERIQTSVRQADVVITNPTHYAIALQYDRETMTAPRVVAKGKGFLAKRIRQLANENKVPIVERKPLARALYAACEVGTEIPRELFKAVAEVLAYVYRLRNARQQANAQT